MNIVNNRIGFIDALRGFSMILVLYGHIEIFSLYGFHHDTVIGTIIMSFRMPLFFFISGFVLALSEKNDFSLTKEISKKARVLLVPTCIIGALYVILFCGADFISAIRNAAKFGYWFTFVSFEIFLIYFFLKRFKVGLGWALLLGLVFYALKLPLKLNATLCEIGNVLSLHYLFEFFQFFVLGVICSKHKEMFFKRIQAGFPILFAIYVLLLYIKIAVIGFDFRSNLYLHIISTLNDWILGYLGISIVLAIFKKYAPSFEKTTRCGRTLQYIGRRTLDIYLLHYFLLPSLPMVGDFFKQNPNLVLELTLGITLSLMVIGCCLLVSSILRTNDWIGYWLFGLKKVSQ